MHQSRVQLCVDEHTPETLLSFLDGKTSSVRETSSLEVKTTSESERPRKRRKLIAGKVAEPTSHPIDTDGFLSIARVDISLAFKKSPVQSYPSPEYEASNKDVEEHPVLLKDFSERQDGEYQCHLTTEGGDTLLDATLRPDPSPQILDVLGLAASLSSRRQPSDNIRSQCVIFKSLDPHYALNEGSSDDKCMFNLRVRVLVSDARHLSDGIGICRDDIFNVCAPDIRAPSEGPWSSRDFYDNVHVPQPNAFDDGFPTVDKLQFTLYPFQKRAVQWLLQREGCNKNGEIHGDTPELPHGFIRTTDLDGKSCIVSQILGILTTDESFPFRLGTQPKGGILAEEMGLGKTVEMIALMCLHKRGSQSSDCDGEQRQIPSSSATLIITPPTILQQWKNEIQTLAPGLSVLVYQGLKSEAGKTNHQALLSKCMSHDVVLASYNVLAKEIHYAESSSKDLRYEKKYEKRLSPLTQIVWWRVVLDEAQMIESGVSNAAKVAKLIPRELAWCVSGTPVKQNARDLFGLLDFLHYEPYCNFQPHMWDRLVIQHKNVFKQIFKSLALRHTKTQIRNEIKLPPQKRVVITVPFTQIEEQHYSTLFKEMCEDCGLDTDGAPRADDWDPESSAMIEKMRYWLARLRQTCLHPEVGTHNRRALGSGKGPLRTVREVLEVMIEQNDTATRAEERTLLLSRIRRGQILEHAEMSGEALRVWQGTLKEAGEIVTDCRNQLKTEIERLGLTEDVLSAPEVIEVDEATATSTRSHRQRLRAAIEVEHTCTFFVANAYFQIKTDETQTKPESDEYLRLEKEEEFAYERAKVLRKELLHEVGRKVETLVEKVNKKSKDRSFTTLPAVPPLEDRNGIESRVLIDRFNNLIQLMQDQAKQISKWREKTVELLVMPLVDKEESDIHGDEYETSTKQQDEVYVYVDALRALIADHHDIVTGQKNQLIKYETDFALNQAKAGYGHSPQLLIKLLTVRNKLLPDKKIGSVRALITDTRELKTTLLNAAERGSTRAAAEVIILNGVLGKLHKTSTEQMKAATALERESELFTDTMNQRLEYYRQLQQISDTVAPFEQNFDEHTRNAALRDREMTERRLRDRIASLRSKGRYLTHLRAESSGMESQKLCIICQSQFEIGLLTSCGHSYCTDCFRLWWNTHRNCPTCKKHLQRNDFHQITYKPSELAMEEEAEPSSQGINHKVMKDTKDSIYSGIGDTTLRQIKNVDLDGSFGTKIDLLARHILWIREHDPGAKSIIFSQYRDFLSVLARAFNQFKISFTSIDKKNGIQDFRDEASLECFFLHAKAHSSGLNLVNATHVFLCEPLINTAIELQAIARVHRIGQRQSTTVWMYLVENTVEKAIYDISVTRRLAHVGKSLTQTARVDEANLESEIEAANTLKLEEAPLANLLTKGSAGGEVVAQDDLWNCLFQQKPGQSGRVSQDAQREAARHLGAEAAEARLRLNNGTMDPV
ncbi:hypothetical protein ACLMJK_005908 [Lecanora helva]